MTRNMFFREALEYTAILVVPVGTIATLSWMIFYSSLENALFASNGAELALSLIFSGVGYCGLQISLFCMTYGVLSSAVAHSFKKERKKLKMNPMMIFKYAGEISPYVLTFMVFFVTFLNMALNPNSTQSIQVNINMLVSTIVLFNLMMLIKVVSDGITLGLDYSKIKLHYQATSKFITPRADEPAHESDSEGYEWFIADDGTNFYRKAGSKDDWIRFEP